MARIMGTLREQRVHHAAHNAAESARKRENPSWTDFKLVRFTESHSSRLDGTKPSVHPMTTSRRKIIHTCTSEDEHKRLENSWILQQKSQGPNSPMKQREDYGKERINRSQDPVKHPNELTRKNGWKWYRAGMNSDFLNFLNPSCKMFRKP